MTQSVLMHQFDNGFVLLAEPMPWLESAALALLVPAGCACDPGDLPGLSGFVCEMALRGCGPRDSRRFVEDLELLGVERFSSVSNSHTSFGGAMPAENLHQALAIYADLVLRPHLPPQQLEDGRQLCLQEVRALEDDLSQKAMLELRRRFYADPYGRSAQGTIESLERIAIDDIRSQFVATYGPVGAILSVAGNFDWPRLRDQAFELWGEWTGRPAPEIKTSPAIGGYGHLPHDSQQTHMGVAYPSAAYSDPDYYQARGAVGVLSDGMSSRLFREIRENRGLCYTVYAMNHFVRGQGGVLCYAGTTSERAQETLDVMLAELHRLASGVQPAELDRLKARIKSSLVMQQESSPARSVALAGDWYYLSRVQTIEELKRVIDSLTCASINDYLAAHPPRDFTIVTLGEKRLETPLGIPSTNAG